MTKKQLGNETAKRLSLSWWRTLHRRYPQAEVIRANDSLYHRYIYVARKSPTSQLCAGAFLWEFHDSNLVIPYCEIHDPAVKADNLPFMVREVFKGTLTPGVKGIIGAWSPTGSVVKYCTSTKDKKKIIDAMRSRMNER